ncbi:hypothetical protein [Lysobacter firmicutimachus]|uniref:DUF3325 domain-containing protein n=1 Tax=Lysobacter firmicutimachus TaxID=1792846 RepID=A0ABU8D6F2_9GAMM
MAPIAYALTAAAAAALQRREFARAPDKARRYRALPWPYKLAGWGGVAPLFAAAWAAPLLFAPAWWASAAFGAMGACALATLDIACVRWDRRNGL